MWHFDEETFLKRGSDGSVHGEEQKSTRQLIKQGWEPWDYSSH